MTAKDPEVTPEYRRRLRRALMAPSGQAVLIALSQATEPRTAAELSATGYVSTDSARAQAYRAAKLGYARQSTVHGLGRPAMAWQITERGRDFLIDLLEAP